MTDKVKTRRERMERLVKQMGGETAAKKRKQTLERRKWLQINKSKIEFLETIKRGENIQDSLWQGRLASYESEGLIKYANFAYSLTAKGEEKLKELNGEYMVILGEGRR